MNFEDYRAIDAINFSALKSMRKSPKQFKYDLENGTVSSVGKSLGTATHTAVLEPEKFNDTYAVFEGKTRKGALWNKFEKENSHKIILKRQEAEHCLRVAREVRANPIVAHYLSKGTPEKTIQWKDKTTGLNLKARVDFLSEVDGKLTILDLKGVSDIRNERFRIEAGRNFYHGQLAWYREGISNLYNGEVADCLILGVEHKAPFDSAVFKMEEESLEHGWYDCFEMLQSVAKCRLENSWPGCYNSVQDLVIRKWELSSNPENDIEELGLDFESDDNSDN